MSEQPGRSRRFRLAEFLSELDQGPDEADPTVQERFTPTLAFPGGKEKISVMRDRYWSGLPLWHQDDFRWDMNEE